MVDNKAAAKIEDDHLQQQGDGGDPGPLLLLPESSGDLWDTAGMRMSALCLNVLQDISDAVSQYSSDDRTLVRRKKGSTPQRKSFADFFRIKKKNKSKKSKESTGDDSPDAKKFQNAAIPLPTGNGSSAKERGRNKSGHGKEMSKEFSFGAIDAPERSATLPSNGKENGNISKDQRGKTLSAEETKSNKLEKVKSRAVTAAGQKQEKGKSLIRPLKRLETSIQKIVTNVNNKFPATEDSAYERRTKENGLNTSTGKPTEETIGTTDEKRLSNRNNNNKEFRDKTQETTGDQSPVSEGQRQMATDAKNAPDAIAVSRESPRTIERGRARDRGDQLRRGRSEEALPSKGQVKRVRRRALSREWVVVKTTTTECTTTFSATSKNDEFLQSPSNESALTSQQGSDDDVICHVNGRRHETLLGSERNRENESISRPQRYLSDRPINDFNNNGFLEFPAGDAYEISSPVLSKEQIELSHDNSPTDTLTVHPSSAPEKTSAGSNSSHMSHNDPFQENSDTSQPMKAVDTSHVVNVNRLLPKSDLFSLDDDESAKDFSATNFSDALNASDANQFTKALEVSSDAGCTLPLTECLSHATLDDGTTQTRQTQESHLRMEIQQLPSPQSAEIGQIQAFDDRTEKPWKEGVDRKLSGDSETLTPGSTKSRWTKRKSAARSSTIENSPTEDDENSSEGQTTPDLPGLLQSIEARDWKENLIQTKAAKSATLSPRLSKPRWTKRKSTARGNRQPASSLLSTNSHPNAVQPLHLNGVYVCAGDGQLGSSGSLNEATENNDCFGRNSVACKPRWTKRQLTVRGMSRALVGVNFAPRYETKEIKAGGASPSSSRAHKQSPRLRGRRRQDYAEDSSYPSPSIDILRRNLPTFSTDDSILSKAGKRRPLITDATPASRDIDDVIAFTTDADSFLEAAQPEPSTRRNQRWEDFDLDCQAESIRPKDDSVAAVECSDRRQRPDAGDDAHPMTEDKEAAGQNSSVCKIPIDVECSADSEIEFERCDDGQDEEDLDITPTNDRILFYSNDDDDVEGSSDSETISDGNESKSPDDEDDLQEDDETSSYFDGSQDGVDSAYFADIDANEGSAYHSPMTVGRSIGLSSDTDPETTDHGTASDDRHWTSSPASSSAFVENTSPSEPTSVRESSVASLEIDKRRRDDATNDEDMSVNEMPGCGSEHKEIGESDDAAPRSAFSQRHSSAEHPDQSSTVTLSEAATDTPLRTDEQDQETSTVESVNADHLKSYRNEEADPKNSWSLTCDQTAMEKDSPKAKHFNKEGAHLKDTKEKQSSSYETSANMQQSESIAPNSVDFNAEGALDVKEFGEDEGPPTTATDSNSARPKSDSIQLTAEGDMTTTNHHQPKADTDEETEEETVPDKTETAKEKEREDKETERKRDDERRPKFVSLDQRRPQPQPRSRDSSRSSSGAAPRMQTNRWRSEEEGSSPFLSLQQHRLLHIDVPYSDSGYSETEADTLSPCSFRSSLSRADTVTEEGGPPVDDSLTDEDDDGARFPFSVCSGGDSASLATPDGKSAFATQCPSGFALEGAIDSAADEVFFSPNTKIEDVSSAAAAASGRSEWEWEEEEEKKREEEESGKWSSLLSFTSYDSGIGSSSTVNKDAFEFPETNLNDDSGDTSSGVVSSCPQDKQDKERLFGENGESTKATTSDCGEMQLTAAPTTSKDVISYMESNVNALSQNPNRNEALCKDISTFSQQMDRDSLCRPLQQNSPSKGMYSSEIEICDEKEREIITRFCDSGFIEHQTVNSATDVTIRSKGNAICAVTENEFNGEEDDQCKQNNQSQIPLRNVDSEMDSRSQALAKGISVDSKHSTKDEFSLKNRGDQSFDEREKTVLVDVDRSESDVAHESPLDSESSVGIKRESHQTSSNYESLDLKFENDKNSGKQTKHEVVEENLPSKVEDDSGELNANDKEEKVRDSIPRGEVKWPGDQGIYDENVADDNKDVAVNDSLEFTLSANINDEHECIDFPAEKEITVNKVATTSGHIGKKVAVCSDSEVYVCGVYGQQQQQQQQQQQKPFEHVSCAFNEGQQTATAIDATEVKTKNESEIYKRIHQHEATSFKNVDSLGNHDETKISRYLGEEENQRNNYAVRPFPSEDASKLAGLTTDDISIDSLKNEEPQESLERDEQEKIASKRNERSTSVGCERMTTAPAPTPAPTNGEAVTQENNSSLLRSVAGDHALSEEVDKEQQQVLTWHENAEMFSVYGDVDYGAEWPRPSAWIWNRSRYMNIHRLSANGDGFFRYPDPLPCQSLSYPLPFTTFCLVRGRQEASAADEHQVKETVNHPSSQVKETVNHPSFPCAEKNDLRSSAEEEKQRRRTPSSTIGEALEESEKEKEMVGGSDNKGSEPSARGEAKGKDLNPKDKYRPETTPSNDGRLQSAENRPKQLSSVSMTTTSNLNENTKMEGSIQRQNNKTETETKALDFLCSANDSSTEFDEHEEEEAATIDCVQSTKASCDGNQSVEEMEGRSEKAPLEEEEEEGGEEEEEGKDLPERFVSAAEPRPFSSSFVDADAEGPSRQHDDPRQAIETTKSRQTPSRAVVESVGATAGDSEEDSVNGRTQQRQRTTDEDEEDKATAAVTSVSSSADDETKSDDSNKSTRHPINTSNNTITYFLASTAGLLSIILLILISVRQTGNVEVNNSKSHP